MSSRLSSSSASLSLSGILENSNVNNVQTHKKVLSNNINDTNVSADLNNIHGLGFQIHSSHNTTRKQTARLTMQSYFDKENKYMYPSDRSPKSNQSNKSTVLRDRNSNGLSPLKLTNQNNLNQAPLNSTNSNSLSNASNRQSVSNSTNKHHSLSNSSNRHSLTNSINRHSLSNSTNRHSVSNSTNHLSSANSIKSNSTKSSSNQNRQSFRSHSSSNNGKTSNSNSKRKSVDTFNSISSSINDYNTKVITDDLECLNVSSPKSTKSNSKFEHQVDNSSIEIDEFLMYTQQKQLDTDHNTNSKNEKRSISKSTSFKSLRSSLSMKSITSSLKHDSKEKDISIGTANTEKRKSLINGSRKMSLENIRSFLKSNRYSLAENKSDYKNNISLPIMQPQTKDKIRNKLRNSSSIVSLSSFVSNNESIKSDNGKDNGVKHIKSIDVNQIHYSLLLQLCSQSRAVSFNSYLNKFQSSNVRKHLTKLNVKDSKNYLFMEFSCLDSESDVDLKPSGVWKILPIDLDSNSISQTIQELTLTMLMSNKKGFVKITSAKVVKGPIPNSLLEMMDKNDKVINNKNQLYLIMRLQYSGITLKEYKLENWKDASAIFSQVLDSICLGESENYEHRDLNIENILINHQFKESSEDSDDLISNYEEDDDDYIDVTIIDHALARGVVSGQLMYRNLYDAEFFKGSGEYRQTIYKLMRKYVSRVSTNIPNSTSALSLNTINTEMSFSSSSGTDTKEWSKSYPFFNLLWVHYLLHVLIFEKGLKPIKMNPILKKKGWLANAGEVGEENAIYEKLLQGYRMVEPSILFGQKKNKYIMKVNNVLEFRDWYQGQ